MLGKNPKAIKGKEKIEVDDFRNSITNGGEEKS